MKKTASKSPQSVPFQEPQIEVVPEEQNMTESEDIFVNQEREVQQMQYDKEEEFHQNKRIVSSTEAKRNDGSIQIDAL